jgi:hypothetical protein
MGLTHKLIFPLFLVLIINTSAAKAQELAPIALPNDSQVLRIEFTEKTQINNPLSPEKKQSEETKKISSSLSKNFGPLRFGVRVNPLQAQGSSVRFDLDLLDTYAILSRSEKLEDITDSFKPSQDDHFIDPELKQEIMNFLTKLPKGFGQFGHKTDQL